MSAATTYTITQLAAEFGVTTRTIRHYEDEGLLAPRRDGTSRVFDNRDRVRLKIALRGARLGFTLAEIRELFEMPDLSTADRARLAEFLARLDEHRVRLQQQRDDVEAMLAEIDFYASQCRRAMALRSTDAGASRQTGDTRRERS